MGVILANKTLKIAELGTPHTHGGDSICFCNFSYAIWVLPIHMGVILSTLRLKAGHRGTPHTHGGDSCTQTTLID